MRWLSARTHTSSASTTTCNPRRRDSPSNSPAILAGTRINSRESSWCYATAQEKSSREMDCNYATGEVVGFVLRSDRTGPDFTRDLACLLASAQWRDAMG